MSPSDPQLKALQDAIFLSKVARARRTPLSVSLATGAELFDQNLLIMRGSIRGEHPEYTEIQVEQEVRRRLKIAKLIDEANLYQDAGTVDDWP